MSHCKFCSNKIHWIQHDEKWKPYDDSAGTQPHNCEKFPKDTKIHNPTISELEDLIQRNYNLLVKVISKINDLEKKVNQ